jgi:hypothetical protein
MIGRFITDHVAWLLMVVFPVHGQVDGSEGVYQRFVGN